MITKFKKGMVTARVTPGPNVVIEGGIYRFGPRAELTVEAADLEDFVAVMECVRDFKSATAAGIEYPIRGAYAHGVDVE